MPSTKATRVKLGAKQANLGALDQRDTLVDELLREEVRASMADKRPSMPIDQVFKRARAAIARKAKAAVVGA
jgi:antitoxin ParD1/3/4